MRSILLEVSPSSDTFLNTIYKFYNALYYVAKFYNLLLGVDSLKSFLDDTLFKDKKRKNMA